MKAMHHGAMSAVFLALLLAPPGARTAEQAGGFIGVTPSQLKWNDAPEVAPGSKIAVIEGDLKGAGPFTFRGKLPPKSRIGVHTHPQIEHVTVLSGTFYFALGDKFDEKKVKAYGPGSALVIPAGAPMYALTKNQEAVLQIHGTGPWGMSYLNPSEAPGKKK